MPVVTPEAGLAYTYSTAMNKCSLCHKSSFDLAECFSCGESFCDEDGCYDQHFFAGPHIVVGVGGMTDWYKETSKSWPRRRVNDGWMNDGTGRDIWIPAIEPDEWFTVEGRRI